MSKRQRQGARLKQIVRNITEQEDVSVVSGRGTAHSWWYVRTKKQVPTEQRSLIEHMAAQEGLLGYYLPDAMPGKDDWEPCVLFEVRRCTT